MTTRSAVPALLPVVPFAAAAVTAMLSVVAPRAARWVAVAAVATVVVMAAWGLARTVDDDVLVHPMGGWAAPLGIEYVLDPLSAFIALLIGVIGLFVLLYPTTVGFGIEPRRGVFLHPIVLLLLGGLLGVAVAGDLFNLFVSLEIYSIASYALIALGGPAAAVASYRYLLIGTVGSSLYLLGVGFIYFTTGTLGMDSVTGALGELTASPTTAAATALVVMGLGTKMAVFPLHVWLPDAHSHAPPAVAALLAAVQVKVAAYALVRILLDVFPPRYVVDDLPVLDVLLWFGLAGIVVGSVTAIRQTDLKRLLAHSTVAQLGYIAVGIGLANPQALVGALLHVVNHAAMKACLFFAAGAILEQARTKKIPEMSGLGPRMPWTMAGFTLAAISMVGLPPTAGFFSKWYLVSGAVEAGSWAVAIVVVSSSVLTLVYFLRMLERVWFGQPDAGPNDPTGADGPRTPVVVEARPAVVAPVAVLGVSVVVLGVVNLAIVREILDPVANRLLG